MLSRTLLCLAITTVSTPLLADTVWLKNGDRLTGTIKVFDGGKLLLQTEYGGAIPLDWKQVKTLQSDQPLLVKQDEHTGEVSKSLQALDDGKVVLANSDAPKTVELASIHQIIKPKPVITDLVWKGNIDAALDFQQAENDTNDYNIAFKTSARHGQWRHNAKGDYNRETTDDVVGTDNWSAEYSLDRFLTEKFLSPTSATRSKTCRVSVLSVQVLVTSCGMTSWEPSRSVRCLTAQISNSPMARRKTSIRSQVPGITTAT